MDDRFYPSGSAPSPRTPRPIQRAKARRRAAVYAPINLRIYGDLFSYMRKYFFAYTEIYLCIYGNSAPPTRWGICALASTPNPLIRLRPRATRARGRSYYWEEVRLLILLGDLEVLGLAALSDLVVVFLAVAGEVGRDDLAVAVLFELAVLLLLALPSMYLTRRYSPSFFQRAVASLATLPQTSVR